MSTAPHTKPQRHEGMWRNFPPLSWIAVTSCRQQCASVFPLASLDHAENYRIRVGIVSH
jgi:hypothetical protein